MSFHSVLLVREFVLNLKTPPDSSQLFGPLVGIPQQAGGRINGLLEFRLVLPQPSSEASGRTSNRLILADFRPFEMGASQSTGGNADGAATTIFIQENEIPEAYRRVGVSDEVVEAVARTAPRGTKIVFEADGNASKLSNDLLKERQENQRLREELKRLSQLQGRLVPPALPPLPQHPIHAPPPPPHQAPPQEAPQHAPKKAEISREDMEEKKRVFEETVNRVKKEFFGYQRENVCGDVEKKLMSCLASNKNTVLNCKPLQFDYDLCISNFRNQVLKEQHEKPKAAEQKA